MTPDGVELTVQLEGKPSQQSQDIARAEFRKQRKRLGVLSAEQETAIEALLMSTVNQISDRVDQMMRLIEPSAGDDFRDN